MPEVPAVNTALDKVATSLTPRLKKAAIDGGWPAEVASKLTLAPDEGGNIVVQYEGPAEDVERLEYGTPEDGPMPVINNFLGSHVIRRDMRRSMKQNMGGVARQLKGMFS